MISLLIRHGNTDAVGRTITGWLPGVHLNAEGRAQAERLAERLARVPIRAVYASPLERAMETAAPLANRLGLDVRVTAGIGEIHCGDWEGLEVAELERQPLFRRFNSFRSSTRIPGGELMPEVQTRMVIALEKMRAEYPDDVVAVISHGDPIRTAIAHYAGMPLDLLYRLEVRPASISTLGLHEWGAQILGVNDMGEQGPWCV